MMKTFSLKNIKLSRDIWREYIANEINPNISFVDFIPTDNSYKVKHSYINLIEKLIVSKIARLGLAEKIIEVEDKYWVTSLSLLNFITNNYYSEEIINALLCLYQSHSHAQGYIVFNTFSYISVHNLIRNSQYKCELEIIFNDIKYWKGIVFPILHTDTVNEFIWVVANPNQK